VKTILKDSVEKLNPLHRGEESASGVPVATGEASFVPASGEEAEMPSSESPSDKPRREGISDFGGEHASRQDSEDAERASGGQAMELTTPNAEERCFNRFCTGKPPYKKVRSTQQNLILPLCGQCRESYLNNMFCSYC
jgi:hypothetical protein